VFIVHSGQIRLSQTAASGKTHVMRFAGPGQSFAEAAVLGEFASPVQADSSEPTVLLQIPADSLRELLERDHELTLAMLRAISLRQRAVVRHTSDIALRDACGRLASYVCEQLEEQSKAASAAGAGPADAKVHLAMQKQDLARHLNLTSETLSRVLRKLMEEGILSPPGASQDEICVADRRALEELAELPSR
jgi:CRP/FNR family transcriptional regulator